MFLYSGLRLSELQQLNVDSIQIRDRQMPSGAVVTLGQGEVIGEGKQAAPLPDRPRGAYGARSVYASETSGQRPVIVLV
jgi:hypothetical protein